MATTQTSAEQVETQAEKADRTVCFVFIGIRYGRGAGVGRERGAGTGLAVAVGVGVAVGVTVDVGVGVGVPQRVSVYCWLSLVGGPGPELPATA